MPKYSDINTSEFRVGDLACVNHQTSRDKTAHKIIHINKNGTVDLKYVRNRDGVLQHGHVSTNISTSVLKKTK